MSNSLGTDAKTSGANSSLVKYQEGIKIDDNQRNTYLTKYGRTTLPSEDLRMDEILKENYLLEYVHKNPQEYIKKRNAILTQIKDEVNSVYASSYEKFLSNDYGLPPREANEKALENSNSVQSLGIEQLETMYPSRFEGIAYKNVLDRQKARKIAQIPQMPEREI